VYPALGNHRIDEIKRKDLKAFFDKLLINGLSSATISLVKAPISGVLSFAVDSELIENNPLDSLKLKRKKRDFKVEPLTDDEADVDDRPNGATHVRRNGATLKWQNWGSRRAIKLAFFTPFRNNIFYGFFAA
jgi:integrase